MKQVINDLLKLNEPVVGQLQDPRIALDQSDRHAAQVIQFVLGILPDDATFEQGLHVVQQALWWLIYLGGNDKARRVLKAAAEQAGETPPPPNGEQGDPDGDETGEMA